PAGQLAIAYLPDLFHLKPGVAEANAVRFISAPPTWWLDRQEELLRPRYGDRARDVAHALAFIARLDQRTPLPIANDPAFHLALYEAALAESWTAPLISAPGLEQLGLERPTSCCVSSVTFEEFLTEFTVAHLPKEASHGSHRFAGNRRLFPDTGA